MQSQALKRPVIMFEYIIMKVVVAGVTAQRAVLSARQVETIQTIVWLWYGRNCLQ